ncbi:hypothetical protein V6N12_001190 [Hibiscus sabdariffa]|uniref:Factor of DNA methylation 1-5/IDN2 domain-containing protein n=1 Tax=Hibiscus sabdariffa TaxID=183260 RepID=A0ABR2C6X7_9ROSI
MGDEQPLSNAGKWKRTASRKTYTRTPYSGKTKPRTAAHSTAPASSNPANVEHSTLDESPVINKMDLLSVCWVMDQMQSITAQNKKLLATNAAQAKDLEKLNSTCKMKCIEIDTMKALLVDKVKVESRATNAERQAKIAQQALTLAARTFPSVIQLEEQLSQNQALALELCSLWQLKIDEDDESLKEMRDEWGDVIYKAVTDALLEIEEYNPGRAYLVPELWNFEEDRKASLQEAIEHLMLNLEQGTLEVNTCTSEVAGPLGGPTGSFMDQMQSITAQNKKLLATYAAQAKDLEKLSSTRKMNCIEIDTMKALLVEKVKIESGATNAEQEQLTLACRTCLSLRRSLDITGNIEDGGYMPPNEHTRFSSITKPGISAHSLVPASSIPGSPNGFFNNSEFGITCDKDSNVTKRAYSIMSCVLPRFVY